MSQIIIAQTPQRNWLISVEYGLQAHDKRLFKYSEKELLLQKHPETFGTYQFGVGVNRSIANTERVNLFLGVGFSVEKNTFSRPFDHLYGRDSGPYIFRVTDRYFKYLVQSRLKSDVLLRYNIFFSLDLMPQFDFLTVADNTANGAPSYSWRDLNLFSIETDVGLKWKIKRFELGMKYRAFQIKRIDKILFNDLIEDERENENYETYNPFKLWFYLGYYL